jgi:hypothetical protein
VYATVSILYVVVGHTLIAIFSAQDAAGAANDRRGQRTGTLAEAGQALAGAAGSGGTHLYTCSLRLCPFVLGFCWVVG